MTKQEKIREGIEDRIKLAYILYKEFVKTGELPKGFRTDYELAYDILSYLRSQGVVIKVEREINGNLTNELFDAMSVVDESDCKLLIKQALGKAGYMAVESLIKEEK